MTFDDKRIRPGKYGYLEPATYNPGEVEDEANPECNSRFFTLQCTRKLGHEGDHAGHNVDNVQIARWSEDAEAEIEAENGN